MGRESPGGLPMGCLVTLIPSIAASIPVVAVGVVHRVASAVVIVAVLVVEMAIAGLAIVVAVVVIAVLVVHVPVACEGRKTVSARVNAVRDNRFIVLVCYDVEFVRESASFKRGGTRPPSRAPLLQAN